MPWFSKVAWTEGLFLQPQHLQQADRHLEYLVRKRAERMIPYQWGLEDLKFDRDLAQQGRIGLRSAVGLMPDGTPFEAPGADPLPMAVEVPEDGTGLPIWLTLPDLAVGAPSMSSGEAEDGTRYRIRAEEVVDVAGASTPAQVIEVATLRLGLAIRNTPKPGHQCMRIGRIAEVRDGVVALDDTVPPPALVLQAHPEYLGYLSRVIGWIEARLTNLAQYASDPSSGGGLQSADYLMLLALNRELPVLRHYARSRGVHPERLYERLVGLAGELASFNQKSRLATDYPPYDHDDARSSFAPVVQDIQALLARDLGRAVRLPLIQRSPNSYLAAVQDRNLFAQASFVLEVESAVQLAQIHAQFPRLCKVGPSSRMQMIVNQNLPGVPLVHLPNPPRQIRIMANKVYFVLDKNTELWREFSTAPGLGLHVSGEWPELRLELWAVPDAA